MAWFDQRKSVEGLVSYFRENGATAEDFGRRVCQTFEAITFAKVIKWYRANGWDAVVQNPKTSGVFRLKFNTSGNLENFTYVKCSKGGDTVQIRHQVRVETSHNTSTGKRVPRANIVCDVAVLRDDHYDHIKGKMHVYNEDLITFAEAKHMDAYGELIAGFIGLVHELQPKRLSKKRADKVDAYKGHPSPFLHLSGACIGNGEGLLATIRRRRMNIGVFDSKMPFV